MVRQSIKQILINLMKTSLIEVKNPDALLNKIYYLNSLFLKSRKLEFGYHPGFMKCFHFNFWIVFIENLYFQSIQ